MLTASLILVVVGWLVHLTTSAQWPVGGLIFPGVALQLPVCLERSRRLYGRPRLRWLDRDPDEPESREAS